MAAQKPLTTNVGSPPGKPKFEPVDPKISEVEVDEVVEKRAATMSEIDYSIYDKKNPNSLQNRCDTRTALLISKIPQNWHHVTESKLVSLAEPEDRDVRLRLAFWEEFNRACRCDEKMSRSRICYGICSSEVWKRYYLANWKKLVFIIRPPRQEMHLHKTLLLHGYDRIAEILHMPIQNKINKGWKEELPNGKYKTHNTHYLKVDTIAIRAIRDTVKMLINMQNVYTLASNYGVGGSNSKKKKSAYPEQQPPLPDPDLPDPDDLEEEIDELENELSNASDEDLESMEDATDIEEEVSGEKSKPGPKKKRIGETKF